MEIKKFGFYFLLGIIIALALKFYYIIDDFLPSIAAGCVLAYIFNPVYLYFLKITKRSSVSSLLVILITVTLILVPVTLIILSIQEQIQTFFNKQTITQLQETVQNLYNFISDKLGIQIPDRYSTDLLFKAITTAQDFVTIVATKMIFSFTKFLLYAFLSLFLMYYLMINSHKVLETFGQYFPLNYRNINVLFSESGKRIKSIIHGQLVIAIIQGIIGALGFLLFDVSGAVIWGSVMVIMSFLPIFGTSFVWIPACVILLIQRDYFNFFGLLLWGGIIHNTIDNIIRPKVCAALGKTHPVTVLLGVFIGIKEWGLIGLVLGPLMISVLIILIKMFREEYIEEPAGEMHEKTVQENTT